MKHISNIEIKNFKSIRHQVIDGCKRINVFIGYPNVGKSNILEALSLFAIKKEIALTDLIRVKEDPTIFFDGFIDNSIVVTINDMIEIIATYSENKLKLNFQLSSHSKSSEPVIFNSTSASALRQITFSNFMFSSESRYKSSHNLDEFVVKKYEFRKNPQPLQHTFSSLEYPFGNNLFGIINSNSDIKKDISLILKEYELELLYDSRSQTFIIIKRTNAGIFTVPYDLLADTIQRLIFYKAAIFSNKNCVLLFEEPESHMFPPYIRKLTTDIIFDQTNQYFIATHSPYVLDALLEDAPHDISVYLTHYQKGETKVKLMEVDDIDEVRKYGVDLFFNLESYLRDGKINNA